MRILGIDPGSRLAGYGCVDRIGTQVRHVTHGTLRLASTSGKVVIPLEDRLLSLYEGISEVIHEFKPQIMVIEKVFFAKNALSALKLGQARGAILLTGKIHGLQIAEYSPTEVKLAITGHGQADKEQVARMVQMIVGRRVFPTFDASDALALGICHALATRFTSKIAPVQSGENQTTQGLALQALKTQSSKKSRKKFSLAESVGVSPKKEERR